MIPQKDRDELETLVAENQTEPTARELLDQAAATARWMIRWRGYAIKFHTNICGRVYCAVKDEEATTFDTIAQAIARARQHGLIGTHTSIPTEITISEA